MSQPKDDPAAGPMEVLKSAPPPSDSVVLLACFSFFFVWCLPSLKDFDEAASVSIFTNILFPEYLDLMTLARIRLSIAVVIATVSIRTISMRPGWTNQPPFFAGSKLVSVPIRMVGWKTMLPFTSVSWNLLGLAFGLSGYISWKVALSVADGTTASFHPWLLRMALVLWEVAAPNAFLVSAVVRYAIWPGVLAKGGDSAGLRSLRNILMHNANALVALVELALLGGLPVRMDHLSFAPLLGAAYVVFSWNATHIWTDSSKYGPQFIYHFFDTTLPGYTHSICLLCLIATLVLFYAVLSWTAHVLNVYLYTSVGLLGSVLYTIGLSSLVMRFRD